MEKLEQIFLKIMEIQTLPDNFENLKIGDIEKWDSFHGLVLVDTLETEFNVKFTLGEITEVNNIGDIKKHLKNHGVKTD